MSDLIDRQEAIDELVRWGKIPDYNDGERNVIACTIGMLSALPSAQPGWIPCSEKMPPDYQWYYATCKSLVDNRENWVVEGCYTPWEHFNSTPMIKCGEAEVIAWMPKGFPEPWEGDTDAH